jgi:hypothetical protein
VLELAWKGRKLPSVLVFNGLGNKNLHVQIMYHVTRARCAACLHF